MSDSERHPDTDWFKLSKKRPTNDVKEKTEAEPTNSSQNSPPLSPSPYDDYYNMKHEKRGVAVIFSHKEYQDDYCSTRYGTEKDRDALEQLFTELRFEVFVYNDPSVTKITNVLDEICRMDHSKSDCLVVAVMTHGISGKLYAYDGSYPTSMLWNLFTGDFCPSLAAKPKLFFIQACRGNLIDNGITVRYKNESDSQLESLYSIPAMADILVMYSTVQGYYAWRDPQKGSPFIQSLTEQLRHNYKKKDILTILTFVNRQVAVEFTSIEPKLERYNNKKEMCSVVSMLTRLVIFN